MTIVIDGTTGISGVDGTASNPSYEGTDSNTGIFFPAADTVAIGTGGTEALRVNSSQNVGIGTSTPSYKLQVQLPSSGIGAAFRYTGGTNNPGLFFSTNESTTVSTIDASASTSGILALNTSGTERMRIDSSGNVGIGTNSPSYTLDVNGITYFRPTNVITSPVQNTWYTIVASAPGYSIWQVVVRSVKSANEQFTVYHLHFVVGGLSSAVQVSNYTVGAGCGNALQVSSDNIQVRVTTTGVSSISTTVTRLT